MDDSVSCISINSFLYFYENFCLTRFNIDIVDIQFDKLIQNAKDFGLIEVIEDKKKIRDKENEKDKE